MFHQRIRPAVTRLRGRLLGCRDALRMRRARIAMALESLHGTCAISSTIANLVVVAARCYRAAGGLIHGEAATNLLRASRGVCAVNWLDRLLYMLLSMGVAAEAMEMRARSSKVARQGAACSGQEGSDGASPSAPEVVGLASSSTTRSSQPSS